MSGRGAAPYPLPLLRISCVCWHTHTDTSDSATLPPTGGTGSFRDAGLKMVVRPAGWCVIAVAAVVAAAGQATADCITNCYDPDEACPACYKD